METTKMKEILHRNRIGCDLIFSFFYSAVTSMRSDAKVRPFPPMYYKPDNIEKDFQALRSICVAMPPLRDVEILTEQFYKLLEWLYSNCDPSLYSLCDTNDFPLPLMNYRPKYIFTVSYNEQLEHVWKSRRGNCKTGLAYHGSKLENFYSITRCGLQQIFSTKTNPLFGEGIYLSKDLPVSILYSPYGSGWVNSQIGNCLSVVAVCEYIEDYSKIKVIKNTSGQTVKDGYIIIRDSDSVRIKYLLVYAKKTSTNISIHFHSRIFFMLFVMGIVISICYTNVTKHLLSSLGL